VKRPVPRKKRAEDGRLPKAKKHAQRTPKPSDSNARHVAHGAESNAKQSAPAGESKLRPGLQASIERVVLHEWTIASLDSRLPAVLSTPHMIGLMEIAAAQAIMAELPSGGISVGTRIEVDHLKAIPAGATVRATAQLAQQDGRFLVFDVEARSGDHIIGRGRVFRAIVEPRQFHSAAISRAPRP
jgi:fluoroacetyl-CoA thioesterase